MTAGRKALNVADDGAKRSARQGTDAGDFAQLLDAHIGASKSVELTLEGEDLLLEQTHFLQHVCERCAQGLRNLAVGIGKCGTDLFLGDIYAERDREAELAQDAAQCVHIPLTGTQPLATQPMQGLDLLSLDGLDGDFANLGTSRGFEQSCGIGAIGFVAPDISFDVMRRQQTHRVAQR